MSHPTDLFTISGPHDQEIGEFYVAIQKRSATDFEAPKLWKGRSGHYTLRDNNFWEWVCGATPGSQTSAINTPFSANVRPLMQISVPAL